MSEVLTCPVCRKTVSRKSSMCFECHLPIDDVRASQRLIPRRRPKWAFLVALVLGSLVLAEVVGLRLREDSPSGDLDAPDGAVRTERKVVYSGLKVVQSDGRFDGTVELTNHTKVHANILVRVHVYDGQQEIGEMSGDVSLKPHSKAVAELWSLDRFRSFDDTVVELIAIPAAVN